MSKTYAQIESSLPHSKKMRQLNHEERWAYLCAHLTPLGGFIGLFRYPKAIWADDADLPTSKLNSAIEKITEVGLLACDADEDFVRITGWFLKKNAPENASRMASIAADFSDLDAPDEMILGAAAEFTVGSIKRAQRWKADRRVSGRPQDMSPKLRFELRAAEERRLTALQLYEDMDEAPPQFPLSGEMRERPSALAARAREALGITVADQLAWRDQYEALRTWKNAVEALGVLVFQIPAMDIETMRGFSIAQMPLPVVGINRGESPKARIFSIMHELTHLMVRQSGICDFNEDDSAPPETRRIEVFCNAVAAEILVPAEVFLVQQEISSRPAETQEWYEETIEVLSRRFNVSRLFIVRRLLDHGRCTQSFYASKQALYLQQYRASRASPSDVRERWGDKRQRILGDAFTGLVIDTYRSGNLTLSDMLGHLQIKTSHLRQLEDKFGVI